MQSIRVAVVGAGLLGTRHARVFHEQPDATLEVVVDVDAGRAQKVADLYGATATTSLDAALGADVDAVAIATPDHLHHAPFMAALRAGKHIFCEKPLATSLSEATEMAEAARQSDRTVMVNFSQRFLGAYAWIKHTIDSGQIGQPRMVNSIKFDTIYVPTGMLSWAEQTSPFYFMSSHDLDLILWYLGARPVEVVARETRGTLDALGVKTHDGVNVLVQFDNGVSANFHSSWLHPNTYPVVADGYMQIIGSEGAIMFNNRTLRAELFNQKLGQEIVFSGPQTATEVGGKLAGAFTDSVRHFLTCIQTGAEPLTSPRRVLATSQVQAAVTESLHTGAAVRLG